MKAVTYIFFRKRDKNYLHAFLPHRDFMTPRGVVICVKLKEMLT